MLVELDGPYITTVVRIALAVLAGALIGIERTYHGRPAGFRTHTLVCSASALLMLLTAYQWELVADAPLETIRVDPTRMGQGIMTGIGFLGAGAIIKEKLTVRGLTTAASIWMTASVGIIIGIGFYFAAFVAVLVTLGTLSLFRWVETITPTLSYARLTLRFENATGMPEEELLELLRTHRISGVKPSYHYDQGGRFFEYELTIRTRDARNFEALARYLRGVQGVYAYSIRPTGE